ncbi:MAG: hypothetical protein LC791_00185 [Acidobacteria bacterium]|nr:hypothetical protein [Acidobacteriota bacterium]
MRYLPPTHEQQLAVVRAVAYASLFDYPVTAAELCEGLIAVDATEDIVRAWYASSPFLRATIAEVDGYYFPRARVELPFIRRRRHAESRRLLSAYAPALRFVSNLPFVRMVALSGSLAHLNAARGADVDLFVITAPGRVWSVTLTALVAARIFGWRRRLCLNYSVSEKALAVTPADLFTANQIVHLRPLIGLDVYRQFLAANDFVARVYPNFQPRGASPLVPDRGGRAGKPAIEWALDCLFVAPLCEWVCRVAYGWYLRRQAPRWQSGDQVRIERECLKLHTTSHRAEVMTRFEGEVARMLAVEEREAVQG